MKIDMRCPKERQKELKMKIARSFLALAIFALALSALSVSWATECTGLLSHSQAQCLSFTMVMGEGVPGSWEVSTSCADYGSVVAMVREVIVGPPVTTRDHFQTLTSGSSSATGSVPAYSGPGGYCCKDLGDLCNRSDVVTAANCTNEFNDSDAADTCSISGTPTVNSDHTSCTFSATCGDTTHTDVSIAYTSMDDLKYCSDDFSTEECTMD